MEKLKLKNQSGIGCLIGIAISLSLSVITVASLHFIGGGVWTLISSFLLISLVGVILSLSNKPDWLSGGMFGFGIGILLAMIVIPLLLFWFFHPFGD